MRRGLLKDLANTPTAMACGWRLYSDVQAMRLLAGHTVDIDLLDGAVSVDGGTPPPSLQIAADTTDWFRERLEHDGVPSGTVLSATLQLRPHVDQGLSVDCRTVVVAATGTFESRDVARWADS